MYNYVRTYARTTTSNNDNKHDNDNHTRFPSSAERHPADADECSQLYPEHITDLAANSAN